MMVAGQLPHAHSVNTDCIEDVHALLSRLVQAMADEDDLMSICTQGLVQRNVVPYVPTFLTMTAATLFMTFSRK